MNKKKWLKERNLYVEQNFGEEIYELASNYAARNNLTLKQVYNKLQISKQNVSDWSHNDKRGVLTKKKLKAIKTIKSEFKLSAHEFDNLIAKAGFTAKAITSSLHDNNLEFAKVFSEKLLVCKYNNQFLYESVGISQSMFYEIKAGRKLNKITILALLIMMDLKVTEIIECLEAAGFCFSPSSEIDIIVVYMITNELVKMHPTKKLMMINDLLDSFDLPMLHSK